MAEAPGEWKQPADDLGDLVHHGEGTERSAGHDGQPDPQLHAVEELDPPDGLWRQAVGAQKVDKVGWREVGVDVLHAEQHGKHQAARQQRRALPRQDERYDENAIHEAVVLEVDVVDEEEAGREKDGQGGGLGRAFRSARGRVDEPESC